MQSSCRCNCGKSASLGSCPDFPVQCLEKSPAPNDAWQIPRNCGTGKRKRMACSPFFALGFRVWKLTMNNAADRQESSTLPTMTAVAKADSCCLLSSSWAPWRDSWHTHELSKVQGRVIWHPCWTSQKLKPPLFQDHYPFSKACHSLPKLSTWWIAWDILPSGGPHMFHSMATSIVTVQWKKIHPPNSKCAYTHMHTGLSLAFFPPPQMRRTIKPQRDSSSPEQKRVSSSQREKNNITQSFQTFSSAVCQLSQVAGSHWHCQACSQLTVHYTDDSKKLQPCAETKEKAERLLHVYNLGYKHLGPLQYTPKFLNHTPLILPILVLEAIQLSSCISNASFIV